MYTQAMDIIVKNSPINDETSVDYLFKQENGIIKDNT